MRGFYAMLDAAPDLLADDGALEARAKTLLGAAPCCLQLRAKAATARAIEAAGRRLLPLCRAAGVPFCVNDRLDVALAVGADIVHLGQDDLPLADAQRVRAGAGRPDLLIGFSTHNRAQALAAAAGGADYIGFGPVFGTRSKMNPDPTVGLEALAEICGAVAVPVVAIGGITLEAVPAVARAGASAAAIIAAIDAAPDPAAAGRAVAGGLRAATMTGARASSGSRCRARLVSAGRRRPPALARPPASRHWASPRRTSRAPAPARTPLEAPASRGAAHVYRAFDAKRFLSQAPDDSPHPRTIRVGAASKIGGFRDSVDHETRAGGGSRDGRDRRGACQFHSPRSGLEGAGGAGGAGGTGAVGPSDAGSTGLAGSTGMVPTISVDASPRADANGASTPDMNCASVNQGAAPLPPDILIIQDRSGSMDWSADATCMRNCGANSRWSQVTAALNQVVSTTDTMVNWGLKFFGSSNSCTVTPAPEVPIGPMNGAAIVAAIGRTTTGSPTPTRNGMNAAAAYMATLTDANPKYLLLATDGEPTCNPDLPASMMNTADSAGAQQAVTDAFNLGFKTFVVGIGDTMGAATLDQMAINGGMPQTGATTSFYQVTDTASLVAALQTILGRVGAASSTSAWRPTP